MRGSLKFAYDTLYCTEPNWIALNRTIQSQPQPASAHCHVRSLLFWDITKRWVVIPYWCFRTTYQFHLQGSRNPKREESMTEVTLNNLLFWDFVHHLIF